MPAGGRGREISEFQVSLVYRMSSRTTRATQKNHVSKTQTRETETEKEAERQRQRETEQRQRGYFLTLSNSLI